MFLAGEMLGPMLLDGAQPDVYQRLMSDARTAIASGRFAEIWRCVAIAGTRMRSGPAPAVRLWSAKSDDSASLSPALLVTGP